MLPNSIFHNNYLMTNALLFENLVGSLYLISNVLYNDIIRAYNNYITLSNLFQLLLKNCMFTDMDDNGSDKRLTELFSIPSVDLNIEENFSMTSLRIDNISLSLFTLSSFLELLKQRRQFSWTTTFLLTLLLTTRINFISTYPYVSSRYIEIIMRNLIFSYLYFENTV
jgi:hypothetical protein